MVSAPSRRTFLRTGMATLLGTAAGCQSPDTGGSGRSTGTGTTTTAGSGTTEPTDTPAGSLPDSVTTESVATGLTAPLDMAVPDTDPVRAYVVDQAGRIEVLEADGLRSEPFLDLGDRMVSLEGYEERGLLGMALHPEFDDTGRFLLRYSAPDAPAGFSHTFVLSEFSASPDRLTADPDSETRLLEIPEPQANHNGGPIAFGPDGYLYVAVGDGGGANDQGRGHVSDWYDANAGGNGQDVTENLLGSILRIDVDGGSSGEPYGIPADNPLVDEPGLDEHFAWGFRNPWGMSFTDGELFVADVGQNRFEEIDLVERGGNYGWNVKEGTHCFATDSPSKPPESCPSATPGGEALIDPIIEYSHDDPFAGVAVVGGYLYTGAAIPELQDAYVFADWRANGRLFVAQRPDADGLWPITQLPVSGSMGPDALVLGFGRDQSEELYVMTTARSTVTGSTGAVHRLASD